MINPKLIAFYFPQFHPIKENDEWWGKGFNDWKLVKESKPLFTGHNQPRIPLGSDYYDPRQKNILQRQIDIAKKYGVGGFMFYHYWFDGKLLLEKPLETLRDSPEIDFPFCICWANESWTRSWIGSPDIYLIKQDHTPNDEIWKNHFNYLLPFFKDTRAIKIDGKPVFIVYQPHILRETDRMFELWNKLAIENGLDGLYIIANKNHNFIGSVSFLNNYNGLLKFQPREAHTSHLFKDKRLVERLQFLRILPESLLNYLRRLKHKSHNYTIVESELIWKIILDRAYINDYPNYKLDIFESGFFEWDNTPRYGKKARIFKSLSTENKKKYLLKLVQKARESNSPFVFWNAWNEWSESSYLEPDEKTGYHNLEIVKNVFDIINFK